MLDKLRNYINTHKRIPRDCEYGESLGSWFCSMKKKFEEQEISKSSSPLTIKSSIFNDSNIYDTWLNFLKDYDMYIKLYKTSKEIYEEKWHLKLEELQKYIEKRNKLPSKQSKNKTTVQLAEWLDNQNRCIKGQHYKYMYNNININNSWVNFINLHEKYFDTNFVKLIKIIATAQATQQKLEIGEIVEMEN
jgi:hypothetical protein